MMIDIIIKQEFFYHDRYRHLNNKNYFMMIYIIINTNYFMMIDIIIKTIILL